MKRKISNFFKSIASAVGNKLIGKSGNYPYIEEFRINDVSFKYWITSNLYRQWYNPEGHRNWEETKAYLDIISKNDRILEVGCNIGFTTSLVKALSGGLVVAMDIVPENVMIAQAQISLNEFSDCHILNLGGDDGRRKIRVQNTSNGFVVNGNAMGSIEVDVIPCDDLISKYGYFDVLKIDVEGYEGNVIRGCKQILSKNPKVIMEIHGGEIAKYNSSVDEIFRILNISNYEGVYCLRSENKLHKFDSKTFPFKDHSTLFLKPKA